MSEECFKLNVILHSEELDATKTEIVSLPNVPVTFQEIREKVEELFSIPACIQTLWIQECEIQDPANTKTSSFYLQSNNTVRVTYPSEGECGKVKRVLKWLAECCTVLDEMKASQNEEDVISRTPRLEEIVFNQNMLIVLSFGLFTPTTNKMKWANIFHFDSLRGTELLVKLHESFIFFRKNDLFKSLHSTTDRIEMTCCIAFTLLSKYQPIRKRVIDCGGLNTCIQTFLRSNAEDFKDYTKYSLCALCNISDLSDAQLYISKQREVIQQVLKMLGWPTLKVKNALVALSLFVNLAECREAHVNLFQQETVRGIMDSVKRRKNTSSSGNKKLELQVFIYYVGLLQAHMIAGAEVLLDNFPLDTLQDLKAMMSEVVAYKSDDIRQYEHQNGFEWDSFLSMLYLYEPRQIPTSNTQLPIIKQLSQLATDILLLSLETTIWKQDHIEVLVNQDLMEYLIMLPWFVPPFSCDRAKAIVTNVAKIRPIQPPSLSSISKAKIASTKWGLKRFRDMRSISHLLSQISI